MKNILIIGAHMDDSELGAGGTAAKLVFLGKNVYKVTLTDTVVVSKDMNLDIKGERAKINSSDACKILGVKELYIKQAPYGKLAYSQEMMQELEHLILEYEIDTCFFHFSDDYNSDHLAAHQICKTAARHCRNLLMFQSNPYIVAEAFYPNIFFDISEFVDKKINALKCYDAEHNRQGNLFETNVERNKIWGYGNHVEYAEGFMAIKACADDIMN